MAILKKEGWSTSAYIARKLGLKPMSVSGSISWLSACGHVQKRSVRTGRLLQINTRYGTRRVPEEFNLWDATWSTSSGPTSAAIASTGSAASLTSGSWRPSVSG